MSKYIILCLFLITGVGNGCFSTMTISGLGNETRKAKEEGKYVCGQPLAVGITSDFYIAYPIARHNGNDRKESAGIGLEIMAADVLISWCITKLFYTEPNPEMLIISPDKQK